MLHPPQAPRLPQLFILVFCAGFSLLSTGCKCSSETPQEHPTLENRPYLLAEPSGPIKGILVYLHGANTSPLEKRAGFSEVYSYAQARGYLLVRPQGAVSCSTLGIEGAKGKVCWDLKDISREAAYLRRLIKHLNERYQIPFQKTVLLGYSNGAYLLGGALQRGLGAAWDKVGLIAGGAVGEIPAPKGAGPTIHMEVGAADSWQLEPSRRLRDAIQGLSPQPAYRETPAGHDLTVERMREFLKWWHQSTTD